MAPTDTQMRPMPELPDSVFEMFSLKGQVSALTGATAGIGFAVCSALAEAGSDLIMFYNSNPCDKEAEELSKKYGIKAKAYQLNVGSSEACTKVIKQAASDFGRLDVFVANAGAGVPGPITEMDDASWHKGVDVNYNSAFYCARVVGQIFKEQVARGLPHGRFIATVSISAHIVNHPTQAAYNGAKAGLLHLCKCLAFEWRDFGRVNTISPGWFRTKMQGALNEEQQKMCLFNTTAGRDGDPKELKGPFLLLATQAGSYMSGCDINVDGGYLLM